MLAIHFLDTVHAQIILVEAQLVVGIVGPPTDSSDAAGRADLGEAIISDMISQRKHCQQTARSVILVVTEVLAYAMSLWRAM